MTTTLAMSPPTDADPYPRRWAAAVVMMIAALMDLLDVTIVNVAIPSIGSDLPASQSELHWLVCGWGWRSVFLVNVPVAAGTLIAGLVLVPPTKERSAGRPDLLGSVVLAAGLVAIVLPLVQGRGNGWPVWGWFCLAAGVCAVAGL